MIISFIVKMLLVWIALSVIFTLVIWPRLITKLNNYYSVMHTDEQDNL